MGYGGIAFIVFWGLVLKVWFKFGPKLPLTFVGMLVLGYLGMPHIPGAQAYFSLFVCFLAIALLLADKVKSTPWR
jgi:hypothetical protein